MRGSVHSPPSRGLQALDGTGAGPDLDRRTVIKSVAATLALAGAAGCGGEPDEHALPYVNAPEFLVPGEPRFYATATLFAGFAQPVIGTTHDGRPTKLEGNPDHPASGGTTDAQTQAALMGLYDPQRSAGPRRDGAPTSWAALDRALGEIADDLDRSDGDGLRLLTGAVTSPTLLRQLEALGRRWPGMRWHAWEPLGEDALHEATHRLYGRPLSVHADLAAAGVVVGLDDDLLGPGPRQTWRAGQWAQRRRAFQAGAAESRLFVAEPAPSSTGAMADARCTVPAGTIHALCQALAAALGVPGVAPIDLDPDPAAWVARAAAALDGARGESLVSVGAHHSPEAQTLGLLINEHLGNRGRTMRLTEPIAAQPPDGSRSLEVLAQDMHAGRVRTLLMLEANPVHSAPGALAFAAALDRVPMRIHAGLYDDETAGLCTWHAPTQHALETWSDARSIGGAVTVIQPLVRPFLNVRSSHVLLERLQRNRAASDRDLVRETWQEAWGAAFDDRWGRALQRGLVDGSAPEPVDDTPAEADALDLGAPAPDGTGGLEVVIRPDPCVWDGSLAANQWLQELPKPLTKVTWDAPIAISETLAAELGIAREDEVHLELDGAVISGAAYPMPGQAALTVVVNLGYGRVRGAGDADGLGYNAAGLRAADGTLVRTGARIAGAGRRRTLALTQRVGDMEDQPLVRTVAAVGSESAVHPGHDAPQPSFYPQRTPTSPSWGMSIDLDMCIGCNACVAACVAENNIAMVGKEEVARGREMHWLRVDRYFEGDAIHFQPVPCMHCEHAPCEMGCPVNATVHSEDGLNLQVYNRCIGTRTCSSYCPYKVRRFNWFDQTGDDPPSVQAARNPDVTVRGRGVMEKCTYCIQRISAARIAAKQEDRPIAEGEVRTACQQACPTQAIVFGDITDPDSAVSRRKADPRDYTLLEEVNTRPRTTYLARIRAERTDSNTEPSAAPGPPKEPEDR